MLREYVYRIATLILATRTVRIFGILLTEDDAVAVGQSILNEIDEYSSSYYNNEEEILRDAYIMSERSETEDIL